MCRFYFLYNLPHTFQYHLDFFNLGCHIKGVAFGGMSIIRGVAFVGSGLNRGVLLYYILQDIRKYLIMYPGSKYDKLDLLLKFCEWKVKLFFKAIWIFLELYLGRLWKELAMNMIWRHPTTNQTYLLLIITKLLLCLHIDCILNSYRQKLTYNKRFLLS